MSDIKSERNEKRTKRVQKGIRTERRTNTSETAISRSLTATLTLRAIAENKNKKYCLTTYA